MFAGNTVKLTGFEYAVLMEEKELLKTDRDDRDVEFCSVELVTKNSVSLSSDIWLVTCILFKL